MCSCGGGTDHIQNQWWRNLKEITRWHHKHLSTLSAGFASSSNYLMITLERQSGSATSWSFSGNNAASRLSFSFCAILSQRCFQGVHRVPARCSFDLHSIFFSSFLDSRWDFWRWKGGKHLVFVSSSGERFSIVDSVFVTPIPFITYCFNRILEVNG